MRSPSIANARLAALFALETSCCLYCCAVRVVLYAPGVATLFVAASSSAKSKSVALTADCRSLMAICCDAGT